MKNNYRLVFVSVFSILLLSSCLTYKDVQFQGVENFKIKKLDTKEVTISFDLKIYNPNNYKIKVKPSEVNILNKNDKLLGKAEILEKIVVQKEKTGSYPVTVKAKLSDVLISGGGSILDLVKNRSTDIKFQGTVKVRARCIGKKIPLDETKTFDIGKLISR